jgi:hypothetical protein
MAFASDVRAQPKFEISTNSGYIDSRATYGHIKIWALYLGRHLVTKLGFTIMGRTDFSAVPHLNSCWATDGFRHYSFQRAPPDFFFK